MRVFFAILLSCILSLNFFFYSEEIFGYSAGMVEQEMVDQTYVNDLKRLGYYQEKYQNETINIRNAILHFQSDSNLVADGIAGKKFKAALNKRLKEGKNVVLRDSVKNSPSSKTWITINKDKRILTVYWNKTAIKKYPVALGRIKYVTPEGKFKVKNKVVNPAWSGGGHAEPVAGGDKNNPLGYRWIGLTIGTKDKYGIHGNNNPYSIGQHASRGCIRMLNEDVEELHRYVGKGVPVWIGSEKQLKKWGVYQNSYVE